MANYSIDAASAMLGISNDKLIDIVEKYIGDRVDEDNGNTISEEELRFLSNKLCEEKERKRQYEIGIYAEDEKAIVIDNKKILCLHREIESHRRSIESLANKMERLSERMKEHEQEMTGK